MFFSFMCLSRFGVLLGCVAKYFAIYLQIILLHFGLNLPGTVRFTPNEEGLVQIQYRPTSHYLFT